MSEVEPPPSGAGWYPDPLRPDQQRWFDGKEWTDAVLEAPATTSTPASLGGNSAAATDRSTAATQPADASLPRLPDERGGSSKHHRATVAIVLLAALAVAVAVGGGVAWMVMTSPQRSEEAISDTVTTSTVPAPSKSSSSAPPSTSSTTTSSPSGSLSQIPHLDGSVDYQGPKYADPLTPFLSNHVGEIVRLDLSILDIPATDSAEDRNRLSSALLVYPGCGGTGCGGTEFLLHDVEAGEDSRLYYDSGAWVFSGYFLVTSVVGPGTGGVMSANLKPLSSDRVLQLVASGSPITGLNAPGTPTSPPEATTTTDTTPQVVATCTSIERRPSRLSWCDDSDYVVNITWINWGHTDALGQGTLVNNTCTPSCATGSYERFPVRIRLDNVRLVGSQERFTRATFHNPRHGRGVYPIPLRPL